MGIEAGNWTPVTRPVCPLCVQPGDLWRAIRRRRGGGLRRLLESARLLPAGRPRHGGRVGLGSREPGEAPAGRERVTATCSGTGRRQQPGQDPAGGRRTVGVPRLPVPLGARGAVRAEAASAGPAGCAAGGAAVPARAVHAAQGVGVQRGSPRSRICRGFASEARRPRKRRRHGPSDWARRRTRSCAELAAARRASD